jgi:hypothetical protein
MVDRRRSSLRGQDHLQLLVNEFELTSEDLVMEACIILQACEDAMWLDLVHICNVQCLEEGLDLQTPVIVAVLALCRLALVVDLLQDREERCHPGVARREHMRMRGLLEDPAYKGDCKEAILHL